MKDKLADTVRQYQAAAITKPTFITTMYEAHHASLFDYAQFLRQTNIKQIEIADGSVIMTSRDRGLRIKCIPGDVRVAPIEILNFGDYEKELAAMMERLAVGARSIFDIGANIGWYALNLAAAYPNAVVHAFEPLATTYAYMVENIHLNHGDNIKAYNLGLADKSGDITFYVYPEGSWNASAANLTERPDVVAIPCQVQTLDDFAAANNLAVDFIKCDVEGAELMVFRGGLKTIARDKPVVCSEVLRKWSAKFHYNPNEIFTLFRQLGYLAYVVRGDRLLPFTTMDDATLDTNFFLLHTEKHNQFIHSYAETKQD